MKAETTAAKGTDGETPAIESPPSAGPAGSDADSADETVTPENGESSSRSEDGSATAQASTLSIKSTASKQPPKPPTKEEAKKSEGKKSEGSLVGKINNLVTVDMGNIGSFFPPSFEEAA
jgi:hypothetical protein